MADTKKTAAAITGAKASSGTTKVPGQMRAAPPKQPRVVEYQEQQQQQQASTAVKGLSPDSFYNPDMPPMDPAILVEAARVHGIEPEVLTAFGQIESPKGPYMTDGRMPILFEAHVFARNTNPKGKYNEEFPTLSSNKWDRHLYGAAGSWQYERLCRAMALDQRAALMACSWGAYQILGENYKMLGFECVEEMVFYMLESEANQFDCFIRFLVNRSIMPALRAKDWATAFYKYNGPAYAKHGYDTRFLQIYRDLTSHTLRKGATGTKVIKLQKLLNKFGLKVTVDGIFGASTFEAVKALQKKWGIKVDGIVGAQTYERLASERVEQTPMLGSKRNIGAGGLIATGVTATVKGIDSLSNGQTQTQKATDILETLKQVESISQTTKRVVVSAKDATEQVQSVNQGMSSAMIVVGFVIVAIGAYIVWTKWLDNKKSAGVV